MSLDNPVPFRITTKVKYELSTLNSTRSSTSLNALVKLYNNTRDQHTSTAISGGTLKLLAL